MSPCANIVNSKLGFSEWTDIFVTFSVQKTFLKSSVVLHLLNVIISERYPNMELPRFSKEHMCSKTEINDDHQIKWLSVL